jgi:signal transduction histidine kinase
MIIIRVHEVDPRSLLGLEREQESQNVLLALGVAHDLANLLTAIGCNARALYAHPGADRAELSEDIAQCADEGALLMRDFLDFMRARPLHIERLRIDDVVKANLRLLRAVVPRDVEFSIELSAECVEAFADRRLLSHVLVNLAANARDAMGKGGTIGIFTHLSSAEDSSGWSSPDVRVVLGISDTGVGIPDEHMNRVLQPYFTTKETGTGLGLSTTRLAVLEMGGELTLRSEVGRGTTVLVSFPRARAS